LSCLLTQHLPKRLGSCWKQFDDHDAISCCQCWSHWSLTEFVAAWQIHLFGMQLVLHHQPEDQANLWQLIFWSHCHASCLMNAPMRHSSIDTSWGTWINGKDPWNLVCSPKIKNKNQKQWKRKSIWGWHIHFRQNVVKLCWNLLEVHRQEHNLVSGTQQQCSWKHDWDRPPFIQKTMNLTFHTHHSENIAWQNTAIKLALARGLSVMWFCSIVALWLDLQQLVQQIGGRLMDRGKTRHSFSKWPFASQMALSTRWHLLISGDRMSNNDWLQERVEELSDPSHQSAPEAVSQCEMDAAAPCDPALGDNNSMANDVTVMQRKSLGRQSHGKRNSDECSILMQKFQASGTKQFTKWHKTRVTLLPAQHQNRKWGPWRKRNTTRWPHLLSHLLWHRKRKCRCPKSQTCPKLHETHWCPKSHWKMRMFQSRFSSSKIAINSWQINHWNAKEKESAGTMWTLHTLVSPRVPGKEKHCAWKMS